MSAQESVFIPSNSASKLNDAFSATSSVPGWVKVGGSDSAPQTEGKQLMKDIELLLSEARRGSSLNVGQLSAEPKQDGGAKKRKSASKSKSASKGKKGSKRGSKSQKGGSKKRGSKASKSGSKKSKAGSKSGSKKSKKSGSKKMKGGSEKRKMPQAIIDIQTVKKEIVKQFPEFKPDIPMTSVASNFIKKHGNVDKALDHVKGSKSEIKKAYAEASKRIATKKAQKKADKEKAKQSRHSDSE